jgi:predicted metalloprotease with PDZ domain
MRHTRALPFALAALLILTALAARPAGAQVDERSRAVGPNAPEIAYTVSMQRPFTHLLGVEARLRYASAAPAAVDLRMPVWTPGSYLVREFERNVQDFKAEAGGRALSWVKVNKNTWRIETGGARELRVTYNVYSNELSVRTNEVNDRHAFWNNAATLMYPDGFIGSPSTLRVEPPAGWKIATGLPAVSGQRDTFRAENFDILYDSPFLVSNFKTVEFEVKGVAHRVVIDGEGNYDPERMRRDVKKIVETEADMMREIPYHDYTFILMLVSGFGGGGLEHLNSTALTYRRFGFSSDADWRSFYGLVAHEFFHLWNVKRIRPDALGPFDYTQENYTRLLWLAEGCTDYYANLFLRRAGLVTDKQYLDSAARSFQNLQETPGRLEQSAEEASFDAWIKEYRPDENTVNSTISYYTRGAILGLLLDLEIRKRSGGAHSLDDVMRALYTDFYKRGRNYTPEDLQRAAEAAAGGSLEEFFSRYVRGREELDYNAALAAVGLRLDTESTVEGRPAPEEAYLGASLAQDGERLTVRSVPAGTPAYEQGLNAFDQIVAVEGFRATRDFLTARIGDRKPGDTITLTLFRGDELRTLTFKLGARRNAVYRILPLAAPTDEQKRNYQSWLGAPQPQAGKSQ